MLSFIPDRSNDLNRIYSCQVDRLIKDHFSSQEFIEDLQWWRNYIPV